MLPKPFDYYRATSIKNAVSALKNSKNAHIHAGGTDLLSCLRDDVFETEKVISISKLKKLKKIDQTPAGGLRIGALSTITEVENHPLVKEYYTALHRGAYEVGSPQLRHQGTIGGNLCQKPRCWYYRGEFNCLRKGGSICYVPAGENQFHCILGGSSCFIVHPSDTAPPLIALEAVLEVTGPAGTRKVPVEEFHVRPENDPMRETYLEPDEIVTAVILPPAKKGMKSSYRKIRTRRAWDFALAGLALAIQFDGKIVRECRAVFSGAAPVPWRSKPIEKVVTGQQINEEVAREASEKAMADARPLSQNKYKIPVFKGMIQEELLALNPT